MPSQPNENPQFTTAMVISWLKQNSREWLHNEGWVALNKRAHAIALGARDYANQHYDSQLAPAEREAFFDGVTLGVLLYLHGQDIAGVQRLLDT